MKVLFGHSRKSCRAALLLLIYSLHLGLFTLLMDASGHIKLSAHQTAVTKSGSRTFPSLAAYCHRLLKHEDSKKHSFVFKAGVLPVQAEVFSLSIHQLAFRTERIVFVDRNLRLPDDSFRRYSLLSTFLI